jgi:hypothetical protein
MVSVAVIGPPMSGKTHLTYMLSGLPYIARSVYNETLAASCLRTDVNGVPWHIWDTPAYTPDAWAAEAVVDEAMVVVVCWDGRRDMDPSDYTSAFGTDRCVIALTRSVYAGANLSCARAYLSTTTAAGTLVPVVQASTSVVQLVRAIDKTIARSESGSWVSV